MGGCVGNEGKEGVEVGNVGARVGVSVGVGFVDVRVGVGGIVLAITVVAGSESEVRLRREKRK